MLMVSQDRQELMDNQEPLDLLVLQEPQELLDRLVTQDLTDNSELQEQPEHQVYHDLMVKMVSQGSQGLTDRGEIQVPRGHWDRQGRLVPLDSEEIQEMQVLMGPMVSKEPQAHQEVQVFLEILVLRGK